MAIKEVIKRNIPEKIRFFLMLENYKDLYFYSSIIVKRFLSYFCSFPHNFPLRQQIFNVSVDIKTVVKTTGYINSILQEANIRFDQGRHSVYLVYDEKIKQLLPPFFSRYPESVGLKIVKSTDISYDTSPYYTSGKIAPAANFISIKAVGTLFEKVIISNILNLSGFAPRVYDCIVLKIGNFHFYGLVVEHIGGNQITGARGVEFIHSLKECLKKEEIEIVAAKRNKDFQPPEFNENIYEQDDGMVYIDIQNFAFLHKGHNRYLFDKLVLSQIKNNSTTGLKKIFQQFSTFSIWMLNREIRNFSQKLMLFLSEQKIDIENKYILDMGCPAGLYTALLLSNGVFWSYLFTRSGTDKEEVERFLFEKGFSRFQGLDVEKENYSSVPLEEISLLVFDVSYGISNLLEILGNYKIQNLLITFPSENLDSTQQEKIVLELDNISYQQFGTAAENFFGNQLFLFKKK